MTAHLCAVPGCGEPAPNATIGPACETDLMRALIAAIALAPDLDIALTRQAQFTDRTPTHGHATQLPYDERAAEAAAQLRGVLSGWVRVLLEAA